MDLEEQDVQTPQSLYPNQKYPVDGQVFKTLIESSLTWLRTNQQAVNILNVFPVPDGDTGTNMVLTMQAAWDEIAEFCGIQHRQAHSHGSTWGSDGCAWKFRCDPFTALARLCPCFG